MLEIKPQTVVDCLQCSTLVLFGVDYVDCVVVLCMK